MKFNAVFLLLFSLLMASCAPKQSIEPAFEVLEDTSQEFHFRLTRSDEFISPTAEFEGIGPIGGIIRNLADAIADLLLEEEDEEIPLEPMTFYLPDLRDFNMAMVDAVQINRVFISLKDQSGPGRGSLGFIKEARLYLRPGFKLPPADTGTLGEEFERDPFDIYDDFRLDEDIILGPEVPEDADLILSYERDYSKLACGGRCLDMDIHPIDFLTLLSEGYTSYTVYLQLVIDAIPKDKLELESQFDISVRADFFK